MSLLPDEKNTGETRRQDWKTARECYFQEVLPSLLDESYDGPELVVLSTGYAEVYADGDVVAFGAGLFNVEN